MTEDNERGRGIFSHADRDYLHGEKDLTEQSERDARYRIRKRVENAILDVGMLLSHLEERDRKRIFENVVEDHPHDRVFMGLFGLPIQGIYDLVDVDHAPDHIEEVLERTIYQVLLDLDDEYMIDVDVTIDVDREKPDIEHLLELYEEDDEELSREEFQYLLRLGEIEFDLDAAIRSLHHMRDEGSLEPGQTHLVVGGDEGDESEPIPYEEDTDFEEFLQDFKKVWKEVQESRASSEES